MLSHQVNLSGHADMAPPERATGTAIDIQSVSKTFGAIAALTDVSLTIGKGEIHAICGENGAGKSTLVKILTGVYRPDQGTISIDGKPTNIQRPKDAEAAGIAFVAQELSLCPHLSVLDNIWLGSAKVPLFHRRQSLALRAREALDMLGAQHIRLDQTVAELSIGQRQLIEIARMLTRDARILILDEPTATLSDNDIEHIFTALRSLKKQGRSIIYITHRLGEVFEICDRATVLRNGQHVETRPVAEYTRQSLIASMLGRSFAEMYPAPSNTQGEPALVVDHLTVPGAVDNFSTTVPRGIIACIAGQVGSGAADIVNAISGLTYNASGKIAVNGMPVTLGSAEAALKAGIMLISGDRAEEGVFQHLTVYDNLVATRLGQYSTFGFLNRFALKKNARELATRVGVDQRRMRAIASELSGGNQQKLAFGRCIDNRRGGVLVMSEPTRGIDVGARADIYRIMRDFCSQGYTIVMTSSDLEEIVGLADIAVTMYRGKQVATYERDAITMHQLLADITHPVAAIAG
jgi:ribose transport system ATP-binding protein/rhamnose transport system ATP-binding protein